MSDYEINDKRVGQVKGGELLPNNLPKPKSVAIVGTSISSIDIKNDPGIVSFAEARPGDVVYDLIYGKGYIKAIATTHIRVAFDIPAGLEDKTIYDFLGYIIDKDFSKGPRRLYWKQPIIWTAAPEERIPKIKRRKLYAPLIGTNPETIVLGKICDTKKEAAEQFKDPEVQLKVIYMSARKENKMFPPIAKIFVDYYE